MPRIFVGPVIVSALALLLTFFFGGIVAFGTVAVLSVLEITLSFDNAVVNAQVLEKMNPAWRRRFRMCGRYVRVPRLSRFDGSAVQEGAGVTRGRSMQIILANQISRAQT